MLRFVSLLGCLLVLIACERSTQLHPQPNTPALLEISVDLSTESARASWQNPANTNITTQALENAGTIRFANGGKSLMVQNTIHNNKRYISASFELENLTGRDLKNLYLIARVPPNQSKPFGEVRNFADALVPIPDSMLLSDAISYNGANNRMESSADSDYVASIAFADASITTTGLLPQGFLVKNSDRSSTIIPNGDKAKVTFSVQVDTIPNRDHDPFSFKIYFYSATDIAEPTPASSQRVHYETSDAAILNPERGFYTSVDLSKETSLSWVRTGNGHTLAYSYVRLDNYRDKDLDATLFAPVERGLQAARDAGIKIILRFAYNADSSGQDTTLEWMQKHLEQVRPLLTEYEDVVAVVQAGFLGAWGEWHHSATIPTSDYATVKAALHTALLNAVPASRMVQFRAPADVMAWYATPLSRNQAFNNSIHARTAHHNDCFLASPTDVGTYYPEAQKAAFYSYLEKMNPWVAIGGETCEPKFPDKARFGCNEARAEMAQLHWDFLHAYYYAGAINTWKTEGCLAEIQRKLGYRYRLIDVLAPKVMARGSTGAFTFYIANDGYGKLYNPRPAVLVFRHKDTNALHRIRIAEDIRPLMPLGGQSITQEVQVRLPADLPIGNYDVLLHLPDAASNLATRPDYSIQLANQGVWQAATGYNALNFSLKVQ